MTKLVLVILDLDKEMRVKANMSDFTIERVLSVKYKDKKWILVAYISNLLNEVKRNYEINDKKMLVIIRYLEIWKHFLENTKSQFKIWTGHKKLEYFIKS